MVKRFKDYVDLINNWLEEQDVNKIHLSEDKKREFKKILNKMFIKTIVLAYKTNVDIFSNVVGESLKNKEYIIEEVLEELKVLEEEE